MFGRKNHVKELADEFVTNIEELEQSLSKARADKIRNEFQVAHFEAEVKLNDAAIMHAEERLVAYKAGRDAAHAVLPETVPSVFSRLNPIGRKPSKPQHVDLGSISSTGGNVISHPPGVATA